MITDFCSLFIVEVKIGSSWRERPDASCFLTLSLCGKISCPSKLAKKPESTVPGASENWANTKATYDER